MAISMTALIIGNDLNLPRVQVVERVLEVLSFVPAVSKLARDTLLQVTDAISANETEEELRVVIYGLLNPSANVRHVVLQALEPFDLEEPENPEILYLALHDTDERNAEFAIGLYESNSVSLDAAGLSRLFSLLGNPPSMLLMSEHETPYVRETAAKAMATALPRQPGHFEQYLLKLIELYEEKVL
jgi:hypothetical protein